MRYTSITTLLLAVCISAFAQEPGLDNLAKRQAAVLP